MQCNATYTLQCNVLHAMQCMLRMLLHANAILLLLIKLITHTFAVFAAIALICMPMLATQA